jgi:hypothetical protein
MYLDLRIDSSLLYPTPFCQTHPREVEEQKRLVFLLLHLVEI